MLVRVAPTRCEQLHAAPFLVLISDRTMHA